LPALTLSNAELIPASATGVPDVSLRTITPPCVCAILTAPPTTVASVFATPAALNAATKSAAVIPPTTAVTADVSVVEFLALA